MLGKADNGTRMNEEARGDSREMMRVAKVLGGGNKGVHDCYPPRRIG